MIPFVKWILGSKPKPNHNNHAPTRSLRSSSQQLLNVPTVTTDFGRRAFSYCAHKIWNEIPATIIEMLQLCKLSNAGSKLTCLVLWTILKHDPIFHLANARTSDSVIYSDIAHAISLRIITITIIINQGSSITWVQHNVLWSSASLYWLKPITTQ